MLLLHRANGFYGFLDAAGPQPGRLKGVQQRRPQPAKRRDTPSASAKIFARWFLC